jgi:hypothetical protein
MTTRYPPGMFTKSLFASALALTVSAPAIAKSDSQIWGTANATVKLSDKWRLSQEIVTRFSDNRNGLYEVESNTLLGYKIGKSVTIAAGYTHDPQYLGGHFTVMEHRAREQLSIDNFATIGAGKLSGRLRLEQRFRDHGGGAGWRTRPYLKYSVPIAGKTNFNLSEEMFVNLNKNNFQRVTGVDRLRSLASISTPLTKTLTGEAGYMNQHGFVRGGPDNDDHIAYFGLSLSL